MKRLALIILALVAAVSCSTVKVLTEGQTRLVSNKIVVEKSKENDGTITRGGVGRYIQQQTPARLPFGLYIYNWTGTKNAGWNKFVERLGYPPIVFDSLKVGRSVDAIQNHLKYNGFYASDVTASVVTKGKKTWVEYRVMPKGRKKIDSISLFYPEDGTIGEDFLAARKKLSLKEGDFLSEAYLDREGDKIIEDLRGKGYFTLTKNYLAFQADTLSKPDSVALRMHLREYTRTEDSSHSVKHEKFTFGDVNFELSPLLKLRPKFVKGINLIESGTLFNESVVNASYNRFTSLTTLSKVNFELTPRDTARIVDVNIALTESKLQGFKLALEASINSTGLFGLSPSISYYHKNIFHGGERLTVNFNSNHQFRFQKNSPKANEYAANVSLLFPQFLGIPMHKFKSLLPSTEIKASFNHQSRFEYTRNIITASYGYKGTNTLQNVNYEITPVKLDIVDIFQIDSTFAKQISTNPFLKNAYQDHFVLSLTGMVMYRDAKDFYVRFNGDVAGNLMSAFNKFMKTNADGEHVVWGKPYSQYVRGELAIGKSFNLAPEANHRLAVRFLAGVGYAYGNSRSLPFERHFWAGGASSMRGWQARSLGPGSMPKNTAFSIPNQTGDMKIEANIEYRFNIYSVLEGALFFDAGNIWTLRADDPRSDFAWNRFYKQIAMDYGAGLRVNLNFLILRFDLGLKLYDPSRDLWLGPANWKGNDPLAFQFGIGYPF